MYGQPATVNVYDLFSGWGEPVGIRETTLGGNIYLDEDRKTFNWNRKTKKDENSPLGSFLSKYWKMARDRFTNRQQEFEVELQPMEIRTFVVEVDAANLK